MMSEESLSPASAPASTSPDKHEVFVALYVRHQAEIASFIRTILPRHADADEVLQETSITLWRRFDQFVPGTSFRNWSYQVAKLTALNHRRRLQRQELLFGEQLMEMLATQQLEAQSVLEQERRALDHCLEKITGDDRDLLAACYATEATVIAVAAQRGVSANQIYKRLDRLRANLERCVRTIMGQEQAHDHAPG